MVYCKITHFINQVQMVITKYNCLDVVLRNVGANIGIYHGNNICICRNSDTISDNNQNMFRNDLKIIHYSKAKREYYRPTYLLKYLTSIPSDIVDLNYDSHSLQWKMQIACPCNISQTWHSRL